jgi:hypothetical protein
MGVIKLTLLIDIFFFLLFYAVNNGLNQDKKPRHRISDGVQQKQGACCRAEALLIYRGIHRQ